MIAQNGHFLIEFDQERGIVRRVEDATAGFSLNYLAENPARFPSALGVDTLFLGDIVVRSWDGRGSQLETTARSEATRTTSLSPGGTAMSVDYRPGARGEGGLRTVKVAQSFVLEPPRLSWTFDLTNETGHPLEIGELAVPLPANMDLKSIFEGAPPSRRAGGEPQRRWHEERVLQHLHIAGHSSYVLLQRPAGDGRMLAIIPIGDTALEAAYQIDPEEANQWSVIFEGPYFLAIHSRAARASYGWLRNRERQSLGLHGASSVVLAPKETRRYGFEFVLVADVTELRDRLVEAGQVYAEAIPSFAVPLGHPVKLALVSQHRPALLEPEGSSIVVQESGEPEALTYLYALEFGTVGQKSILVRYGDGRWTRVLFYAIPSPTALLLARARFIVHEQIYRNPADRYHRHLAFLPYADQLQASFTEADEAWQVGGSDEYGLPIAMFLAEKNAIMPDAEQIRTLETYIDQWVLRQLQDPTTLNIRRGLYFGAEYPSRNPAEWLERDAAATWRFNNYPLLANIYHSMAKVAQISGLTRVRTAKEYLDLAWRTAVRGFEIGDLNSTGAPAGANLYDLLHDLRVAGSDGYMALAPYLDHVVEAVRADRYPYGSELYIDQTAHDQVYAAAAYAHDDAVMEHTAQVALALRAGSQPAWYRFGNDQRGAVCCWYGTPQNSEVLLRAFERTGNMRQLKLGMGGLTSFLTCVRADGTARGWFTWWPDRLGFDTRSLDTDLGLYNYLRAANAYAVTEELFGLVGYGCVAEALPDGTVRILPDNGVNNGAHFCDHGIEVRCSRQLRAVSLMPEGRHIEVDMVPGVMPLQVITLTIVGANSSRCSVESATSNRTYEAEAGRFVISLQPIELGGSGTVHIDFGI